MQVYIQFILILISYRLYILYNLYALFLPPSSEFTTNKILKKNNNDF